MIKIIKMIHQPLALMNTMKMMKLSFISFAKRSDSSNAAIHPGSGFTLIETLVAATILGTVLLGPVAFLSTGLARNNTSEDLLTALYLAQEGVELVRRIRENNILAGNSWDQGLAAGNYQIDYDDNGLAGDSGSVLRYDSLTGLYSYSVSGTTATAYTRRITLSVPGADQLRIVSRVQWTNRFGISKSVQLEEVLYNWL